MSDYTLETLRILIATGPWCQTEVLKPYAAAWEAEQEIHEDFARSAAYTEGALRKRLEEATEAMKDVAFRIGDRTHGAMASECNQWRERLERASLPPSESEE